jgi:hypothetical protein
VRVPDKRAGPDHCSRAKKFMVRKLAQAGTPRMALKAHMYPRAPAHRRRSLLAEGRRPYRHCRRTTGAGALLKGGQKGADQVTLGDIGVEGAPAIVGPSIDIQVLPWQ